MPSATFLITDLHRGGSPLLLADLAPGLQKLGWDIDIVSIAPPGEISALLQSAGIPTSSLHARSNRDLAVLPRFIRHLRACRPDIVCSILLHANLLATLAQPFINSDTSLVPPIENRKSKIENPPKRPLFVQSLHTLQAQPRWHWLLQRCLSSHADAFLAPSRAIIRQLQSLGAHDIPRPTVIPNGIHVPRFFHAAPIENPPWPQHATVIGSISRFDPVKRLHLLIHALALLPQNFHLALVGCGTPQQEQQLRALAAQLPITHCQLPITNYQLPITTLQSPPPTDHCPLTTRIHFPGPTAEPERWYKSFNIYCNLSASEGYGLSLAEAACAGLPIVSCATPALRDTLAGIRVAWLPTNPTPAEIARALSTAAMKMEKANQEVAEGKLCGGREGGWVGGGVGGIHLPSGGDVAGITRGVEGECQGGTGAVLARLEQRYSLQNMVNAYDALFRQLLRKNQTS